MKGERFVDLVDHRQADTARLGLVDQFAVFLPAVQGGQGVEFTVNRPIRANHHVFAPHQPDTHDLLQQRGPRLPVG